MGLFVRLKGKHPLAAARKMQQLGDGVAAVGAKVGKMFVVCGPQDVLIGLLHRRLAVKEVVQLAAELKVDDVVQHLFGLLVGQHRLDLANSCSCWRTKSRVKRLTPATGTSGATSSICWERERIRWTVGRSRTAKAMTMIKSS